MQMKTNHVRVGRDRRERRKTEQRELCLNIRSKGKYSLAKWKDKENRLLDSYSSMHFF